MTIDPQTQAILALVGVWLFREISRAIAHAIPDSATGTLGLLRDVCRALAVTVPDKK